MNKNETWELLLCPTDLKTVTCKWVDKVKKGSDTGQLILSWRLWWKLNSMNPFLRLQAINNGMRELIQLGKEPN